MTITEAQNKICPFMAHCVNPHQTYDANFSVVEYQRCLTDLCMAWDKLWGGCIRLKGA